MNKWTILSVVVLVGILSMSLWLITQSQDPQLEAESAAEQEIGVEEFDSGSAENPVAADSDSEIILEPDLTVDSGTDGDEQEAVPADPVDESEEDTDMEKSPEPSDQVSP